jgi:hypothetical protein
MKSINELLPAFASEISNLKAKGDNSNLKEKSQSFAEILDERERRITREKTALIMSRDERKSAAQARIERKKARLKMMKKLEVQELYEERLQEAAAQEIEGQIRRARRAALAGEAGAITTSKPKIVTRSLAAFILADLIG